MFLAMYIIKPTTNSKINDLYNITIYIYCNKLSKLINCFRLELFCNKDF